MENDLFSRYFQTIKAKPKTCHHNKENTRPVDSHSPVPGEKTKKTMNSILTITITESRPNSIKSSQNSSMLTSRRGSSSIINESSVIKEVELNRPPIEKRIEQLYLDLHNIDLKTDEQLSKLETSKSNVKLDNQSSSKKFKAKPVPKYQVPFVVYKSTKPLTIPKDPEFTARSKSTEKNRPKTNSEETYEEKMQKIREKAKSNEKPIISRGSKTPNRNRSELLEKFKVENSVPKK